MHNCTCPVKKRKAIKLQDPFQKKNPLCSKNKNGKRCKVTWRQIQITSHKQEPRKRKNIT